MAARKRGGDGASRARPSRPPVGHRGARRGVELSRRGAAGVVLDVEGDVSRVRGHIVVRAQRPRWRGAGGGAVEAYPTVQAGVSARARSPPRRRRRGRRRARALRRLVGLARRPRRRRNRRRRVAKSRRRDSRGARDSRRVRRERPDHALGRSAGLGRGGYRARGGHGLGARAGVRGPRRRREGPLSRGERRRERRLVSSEAARDTGGRAVCANLTLRCRNRMQAYAAIVVAGMPFFNRCVFEGGALVLGGATKPTFSRCAIRESRGAGAA